MRRSSCSITGFGAAHRTNVSVDCQSDYDFLLACTAGAHKKRGKMPNFVAVNFYQNGDVIGVD